MLLLALVWSPHPACLSTAPASPGQRYWWNCQPSIDSTSHAAGRDRLRSLSTDLGRPIT